MKVLMTIFIIVVAVSSAYGDDAVQLTFDPGWDLYPSWSPDGTRIAYNSEQTTVADIYTIPWSGGTPTRITTATCADIYPEWSPDSSTIVYFSSAGEELMKIPSTGGTPTRFTHDNYMNATPSWSSDDSKIAYSGWYLKSDESGDSSVFWVPADDGYAGPYLLISGGDNRYPNWNPSDSYKVTLSRNGSGTYDVWTKTINGESVNLTNNSSANDADSSYSPNGEYIAFGSDRGGNSDIWIMSANGSNLVQVTDDPAGDGAPDWSPDGDKITFFSDRSGNYDIWVIDVSHINIESASLGEIKATYATDEMIEKQK